MGESSTALQKSLPLQDRIAIVTGASRGIGRAIALHLSFLGAKLIINYASTSSSTIADLLTTQLNFATPEHPRAVAIKPTSPTVEAMIKILAKKLKGTGITVNCVAPGPIATEMFFDGKTKEMIKRLVEECPLGRLGQTEDVAPVVGFLASDAGEWINGQVIRANDGYV